MATKNKAVVMASVARPELEVDQLQHGQEDQDQPLQPHQPRGHQQ